MNMLWFYQFVQISDIRDSTLKQSYRINTNFDVFVCCSSFVISLQRKLCHNDRNFYVLLLCSLGFFIGGCLIFLILWIFSLAWEVFCYEIDGNHRFWDNHIFEWKNLFLFLMILCYCALQSAITYSRFFFSENETSLF